MVDRTKVDNQSKLGQSDFLCRESGTGIEMPVQSEVVSDRKCTHQQGDRGPEVAILCASQPLCFAVHRKNGHCQFLRPGCIPVLGLVRRSCILFA